MHEGFALLTHPRPELRGVVSRAGADARALRRLLLTQPDQTTVLRGELSGVQKVTWIDGRTDYGRAFELFEKRYPDAIGTRTSLLILGDARSNYGDLALPTLQRLADRARHAHWLNPERGSAWDSGDSEASRFDAIVPMVECRNLQQLGEFVRSLA